MAERAKASIDELKRHPHTKDDGSWWEYDARGRPLCRVCPQCKGAKMSTFNPKVLNKSQRASREGR